MVIKSNQLKAARYRNNNNNNDDNELYFDTIKFRADSFKIKIYDNI